MDSSLRAGQEGLQPFSATQIAHLLKALEAEVKWICSPPERVANAFHAKNISMAWLRQTAEGVIFKALIQPRSSKNEIVGLQGDALKIRLTAPPVEGAANKMLAQFLAESLSIRKSDVSIVRGRSSRTKHVLVRSATLQDIETLLDI